MSKITVNVRVRGKKDVCFIDVHTPKGYGSSSDKYCRMLNSPLVKKDGTFYKSALNEISSRVKNLVEIFKDAGEEFPTPSNIEDSINKYHSPVYQITVDTDSASMPYGIQGTTIIGFGGEEGTSGVMVNPYHIEE
jgi:hypothetical protein